MQLSYMEGKKMKICLVWLGRIGDFIVSLPFISSLKGRYPKSYVAVVVNRSVYPLAKKLKYIDDVIIYPKPPNAGNILRFFKFFRTKWDVCIDLNPSYSKSSGYLSLLSKAEVKMSFSKEHAEKFYTHTLKVDNLEHMVLKYKKFADYFQTDFNPGLKFEPDDDDREKALSIWNRLCLDKNKKNIGIHPGNFKKFGHRWPEEKFIELSKRIASAGEFNIIYITGPNEDKKIEDIVSKIPFNIYTAPVMPLTVLAAFFSFFDLMIFNPTGTMHLAALVKSPIISLHTAYSYKCWRPLYKSAVSIKSDDWESLRSISVDEVWGYFKSYFKIL